MSFEELEFWTPANLEILTRRLGGEDFDIIQKDLNLSTKEMVKVITNPSFIKRFEDQITDISTAQICEHRKRLDTFLQYLWEEIKGEKKVNPALIREYGRILTALVGQDRSPKTLGKLSLTKIERLNIGKPESIQKAKRQLGIIDQNVEEETGRNPSVDSGEKT